MLQDYSVFQAWANSLVPNKQDTFTHAAVMLGQRRRRWANITSILCVCLVFAWPRRIYWSFPAGTISWINVGYPLVHRLRRWTNSKPALIQCRVPARLLRNEPPFQKTQLVITILAQLSFSALKKCVLKHQVMKISLLFIHLKLRVAVVNIG